MLAVRDWAGSHVLIDDWSKDRNLWIEAGGLWISEAELTRMGL
jgi:hypothetical protein